MKKRGRYSLDRQDTRSVIRFLAQFSHCFSEFLCASILIEERYPELSVALERMAEAEAKQFRLLGQMMLRKGMDPSLRMISYAGVGGCPTLVSGTDENIERFLRDMRNRTRMMGRDVEWLMTAPGWEGEDEASLLIDLQRQQLRQLDRMLS